MASNINPNNPVQGNPTTQSVRNNFAIAAQEITALQAANVITGVTAGTGLTGGGNSGSITLALTTPVAVINGGTGATTAAAARTSLGAIGTVTAGTGLTGGGTGGTVTVGLSVPVAIANGGTNAITANLALDSLSGASGATTGVPTRASNGTWSVTNPPGTGTITGVTAGTGLTGGGVTGTVTLNLAAPVTVANGGTGTTTSFTTGSVLFAGPSGIYSQDNANLFWDDTNNFLGIGTAAPASGLHVVSLVSTNPRGILSDQYTNDGIASRYAARKSRGTTVGSMTAVSGGDTCGSYQFQGSDGTSFVSCAIINGLVDGTVSTGIIPGRLSFQTASSTGALTERLRIDSAGNATHTGPDLTIAAIAGGPTTLHIGTANATSGSIILAGGISGSQTWRPAGVASGLIVWPAGTVDFSATGGAGQFVKQASVGAAFTVVAPSTADLTTTATNDNAPAGDLGEYISAVNSGGTALTNATPANIASIVVTAGDWDVTGGAIYTSGLATNMANVRLWINTVSATEPTIGSMLPDMLINANFIVGTNQRFNLGQGRVSVAGNTTVFIGAQSDFSGGAGISVQAWIAARRVR